MLVGKSLGKGIRWGRWPLGMAAGLVGGCLVVWGADGLCVSAEKNPPGVRVTISKETTYLTEPLRPDGYPDYLAALNQQLAQGVTPENNAAVLFWQAMGPKEIPSDIRAEYFRRLAVPVLPEEGPYFRPFSEYGASASQQGGQKLSSEQLDQMYSQTLEQPWKREQFALVAEWLEANEKPLALLVEASRRPRRYDPLVVGQVLEGQPEMLAAALLPAAGRMREAVRALRIRAMYRLGEGKIAEAWEDLLAIHRLARLMGRGATLIDNLVAVAIDTQACQVDQLLANQPALSAQQALAFRDALVALGPLPPMADKIDLGERYMYLDVVCTLVRSPGKSLRLLEILDGGHTQGEGWTKKVADFLAGAAGQTIDWDLILRMGNQWYDQLVEAGRKPTPHQKAQALDAIDAQIRELKTQAQDPFRLFLGLLSSPGQKASEHIGQVLISLLVPAIRSVYVAEDRAVMVRQLTVCSFALAAYRAEHGTYPDQLVELVPRYLAAVPMDMFAPNQPIRYRRTEDGIFLYSVGPNGQDDGGRGPEDVHPDQKSQGDDLVVRMRNLPTDKGQPAR